MTLQDIYMESEEFFVQRKTEGRTSWITENVFDEYRKAVQSAQSWLKLRRCGNWVKTRVAIKVQRGDKIVFKRVYPILKPNPMHNGAPDARR